MSVFNESRNNSSTAGATSDDDADRKNPTSTDLQTPDSPDHRAANDDFGDKDEGTEQYRARHSQPMVQVFVNGDDEEKNPDKKKDSPTLSSSLNRRKSFHFVNAETDTKLNSHHMDSDGDGEKNQENVVVADKTDEESDEKVPRPWEGQDYITFPDGHWIYYKNRPVWLNSLLLFVLIGTGIVEGYIFVATGFVNPATVTGQMTFQIWIVMKLFISGFGASLFVQGLMDLLIPSIFNETRVARFNKTAIWRSIVGGGLVGLSLIVGGSGPTILPAMLAANVGNSWAGVLGFIAGGITVYVMDYFLLAQHKEKPAASDRLTVDEWLNIRYWKLAIPGGLLLFGAACVLEFAIPNTTMQDDSRRLNLGIIHWPAITAGVAIGINQAFFRLIAHHGEGGSTSVLVIVSFLTFGKIAPNNFPIDLERKIPDFAKLWQVAFVWVGMPIGAVIGAQTIPDFVPSPGLNIARNFMGGFFALLGAKIGAGCTCGELTGDSELGWSALLQTGATFAIAIPVGFIFQVTGAPNTP